MKPKHSSKKQQVSEKIKEISKEGFENLDALEKTRPNFLIPDSYMPLNKGFFEEHGLYDMACVLSFAGGFIAFGITLAKII